MDEGLGLPEVVLEEDQVDEEDEEKPRPRMLTLSLTSVSSGSAQSDVLECSILTILLYLHVRVIHH